MSLLTELDSFGDGGNKSASPTDFEKSVFDLWLKIQSPFAPFVHPNRL